MIDNHISPPNTNTNDTILLFFITSDHIPSYLNLDDYFFITRNKHFLNVIKKQLKDNIDN